MSRRSHALAVLIGACSASLALAQPVLVPTGGELQVNTYTTSGQTSAAVARDGAGNFVVVWNSDGSAGSDTDSFSIQGQRYDGAGLPLGAEFQVNNYTTSGQFSPRVAADAAGNFVVVWTSYGSPGSDNAYSSIQARRYDGTGTPLGGQFQVNTYATSFQNTPDVAADPGGRFVVVWQSYGSAGSDTSDFSVHGRRYDSLGAPLGAEFEVNTYATSAQTQAAVAGTGAGGFVVAWQSDGSPGSDSAFTSIQARRYDGTGTALGPQFQVNTYTTSLQFTNNGSVTNDGAGGFVVIWMSVGSAGSDTDGFSVQGRRYDSGGTPLGGQFQVNTYTTGAQYYARAATDGTGNFLVTWSSSGGGSDPTSVLARLHDAGGVPVGAEFQVNTYTTGVQNGSSVAADAVGNFAIVWGSTDSGGTDILASSVHGQRYATGRPILGKKILVKDPTGNEIQRGVIALGKESTTDIGPAIIGNPVANGATLRVIANGMVDSDQTYVLDAAGWSALATGFKYAGPTAGDGDPVKKVLIKRTPGGTALLKALVKGNVGTQSLDVVPPNLGDDGGIVLSINGGGTYCVAFGGAAGGSEQKDDGQVWKISNAGAQTCPAP
jgi:hypothetical protein